ncbi:MAG: plasmid mobilization relaxosome protein MobC [Firmicutes bacterium]|nr:plasmid mobilization relaxosome protein MobC [Bacillota bacterium]
MRNRNVPIQFFLDKKEAEHLKKLVKRSGLTQSTYLRHLINGVVPQDAPPPDYYAMMKELRGIGTNLNYIAQLSNALGFIDTAKYDEAVQTLNRALLDIIDAVRMPRKRE